MTDAGAFGDSRDADQPVAATGFTKIISSVGVTSLSSRPAASSGSQLERRARPVADIHGKMECGVFQG